MTQTINFVKFPFTHKGIDFISRISEESSFLPQIKAMGEAFIDMNKQAIDELLSITDTTTKEDLVAMIAHINEGGTQMFIELAGA